MYIKSPMEQYNKNNPFIIIAKKVYDNLIDNIQVFGKWCVAYTIPIFVLWLLFTGLEIYNMVISKSYIISSILIVILLIVNFGLIYNYRKKIEYFISVSPSIQEFTRLSKLEINDIIALNNEELLKCVYGLYELHGELKATTKYYYKYFIAHICAEILLIVISILK